MNFENVDLGDFQDACFNKIVGQTLTQAEVDKLKNNYWIKISRIIAPNNLVIRHLCLLDLISKCPNHYKEILDQLKKLTYSKETIILGKLVMPTRLLYAEGYSYWLYIKNFLQVYNDKFLVNCGSYIQSYISKVDSGFQATAYLRGTVMYPAPFGDLRDQPLEDVLQNSSTIFNTINIAPINKRNNTIYQVESMPIGLNGHIPLNNYIVDIKNGEPVPFSWYQGYSQEYPTMWSQMMNTLNPKRVWAILKELINGQKNG